MTDRELLELAARAMGIECRWVTDRRVTRNKFGMPTHHRLPDTMYVCGLEWNPLTNDGDCARMENKCGLIVDCCGVSGYVMSATPAGKSVVEDFTPGNDAERRRASCLVVAQKQIAMDGEEK